jgi:hypothetical protein
VVVLNRSRRSHRCAHCPHLDPASSLRCVAAMAIAGGKVAIAIAGGAGRVT